MKRVGSTVRVESCYARQIGKSIVKILLTMLLLCAVVGPARAQTGPLWITNQGGYSGDCYGASGNGNFLGPNVEPNDLVPNDLGQNYQLPTGPTVVAWDNAYYDNGGPAITEYTDPWNYTVTGNLVLENLTDYTIYVDLDLWMQQGYHTSIELMVPNGGWFSFPFNGITALLPTASQGYFYLVATPVTPAWASGSVLACTSVSFVTTEHN